MNSTRVIIHGSGGRMGEAIIKLCQQRKDLEVVAEISRNSTLQLDALEPADVLIDFSQPEGLQQALDWCLRSKTALLSGTTGIDEGLMASLRSAGASIPVFWAPNTSIGVNLTAQLVDKAAQSLGMTADVEITEAHHRYKKDAPSGTALQLAQAVANARGQDFNAVVNSGQQGDCGLRADGEIGISSVRAGDIVGEHTVLFQLPGEVLEITHRATDRNSFARGALEAARWLSQKSAGFYNMRDLLHHL
ncbi:MAG: 4-hydroxy-tetrahydrodipicolinate reductase [Xanthomonadales bacterium]|nr:4-hydroxy-tetrahydrodipicolinate reductase [Xanthomonadales bacterium]